MEQEVPGLLLGTDFGFVLTSVCYKAELTLASPSAESLCQKVVMETHSLSELMRRELGRKEESD